MRSKSILVVVIVVLTPFFTQAALADFPSFPICTDTGFGSPSISDDIVVWGDRRNDNLDIYGKNLSTDNEFAVCTGNWSKYEADISGNIVVWRDGRNTISDFDNWDIYGYSISTGDEFAICTDTGGQSSPSISGDIVVWSDSGDIYGKNINTGETFTVCTASGSQSYPVIDGDLVIWRDSRNGGEHFSLYGYDLSSSTEFPICLETADDYFDISGDVIVWQDTRNDQKEPWESFTNLDIYGFNLANDEEFEICTESGNQSISRISGDIVVWTDERNGGPGNRDIYGYDLFAESEFEICTALGIQTDADISGNLVVWDNEGDIYGATIPEPTTLLLLGFGVPIVSGLRKRKYS